nr:MAG TPA: hypothetical protein [Caudoviricetes sp.]
MKRLDSQRSSFECVSDRFVSMRSFLCYQQSGPYHVHPLAM